MIMFLHVGELGHGAINLGIILINLQNTTQLAESFSSKVGDQMIIVFIF